MDQAALDGCPWRPVPLTDRDHRRIDLLQVGVIEVGTDLCADLKSLG
ncbi:hypothetical protein OG698_01890 [Streptomyces sp. NBC_01003]|nr:hypothetical protein OG698_01890 [Streptomyces sp. NBC_01003]